MNPHYRLAFFVFKLVFEGKEYHLSVWRGDYLGFPGGPMGENEEVIDCARRMLTPIAWIRSLGDPVQIVGGSCTWDNKPATFDLFSLPTANIIAPVNTRATCAVLEDREPFDMFVRVFQQAIRKPVEIGQVQSAA